MFIKFKVLSVLIIIYSASQVLARPQYAARQRESNCTACHFSPAGAGARTLYGKEYGSRDLSRGVHTETDIYTADFKALTFGSIKDTHKSANGFGVMNATISASVPVYESNDGSELRAVGSFQAAGFSGTTTAEEIYARYQTNSNGGFRPEHISIGKFNIPFGVQSGEHRTYTRRQSLSSTTDYEAGIMLSADVVSNFHYDFSFVNGFQSAGGLPSSDITWASALNLRYIPFMGPVTIGTSIAYHNSLIKKSPAAYSMYGLMSLSEKSSFVLELSIADGWNDQNLNVQIGKYIDTGVDSLYYESIKNKKSFGLYSRFDYDLSKRAMITLKIDALALDKDAAKDAYYNFGIGLRYWILANADIDVRFEKSIIGNKTIDVSTIGAANDTIYILTRMWL